MTPDPDNHPDADALERYALGNLSESELDRLEEHLLVCEPCQDELAQVDAFVSDMKYACANAKALSRPSREPFFMRWFAGVPRPALAGAFAGLLVLACVPFIRQPAEVGGTVPVELAAVRGDADAVADANHPLELRMDVSLLRESRSYRVEVVNAFGAGVWKGTATLRDGKLLSLMAAPLHRGDYWVRVFGNDTDLLREFKLTVK